MTTRKAAKTRSARRSHQMALCAIKATPAWHPTAQACGDPAASALPTANSLWLGLRRGPQNNPAANMRQKGKMKKNE